MAILENGGLGAQRRAGPGQSPGLRRFLSLWLVTLLGLTLAVAIFNAAVDPYGILGTPRVPGLTAEKSAAADRPRLTKSYLVDRVDAQTLLLGSSNVDVGFNPASSAWPQSTQPVFNLAIDGSLPGVLHRYLQHALIHSHPKLVILGLSLEDAMIMPQKRLAAADQALYGFEQRLHTTADGAPNPGYLRARLEDTLFAILSTQALTDSVLTLLRQHDPGRNAQTPMGRNTGGSFIRWTAAEGPRALVMVKDREKAPQYLIWAADPRLNVHPVADIIRLAHDHGAQVIVFIQPSYVDQLEILRQSGLTPAYNAWKTEVARTVAEASTPQDPVPLWDFSGYSPYTTESLPTPAVTTPLEWFWEPIHYREALADLLIRRMLAPEAKDGANDLGVQITPATLPAHLAEIERQQREWVATHQPDVDRIATIVDAAAHAICHAPIAGCPKPGPLTTTSR